MFATEDQYIYFAWRGQRAWVMVYKVTHHACSVSNNKLPGRPKQPINRLGGLKIHPDSGWSVWRPKQGHCHRRIYDTKRSEYCQKHTAHYFNAKGPLDIDRATQPSSTGGLLCDQNCSLISDTVHVTTGGLLCDQNCSLISDTVHVTKCMLNSL